MKKVRIECTGLFGCMTAMTLALIWVMAIVEIIKQLIK
jgi:hypothetical protein